MSYLGAINLKNAMSYFQISKMSNAYYHIINNSERPGVQKPV